MEKIQQDIIEKINKILDENKAIVENTIGYGYALYKNDYSLLYKNFTNFFSVKKSDKLKKRIEDQINNYLKMLSTYFSRSSKQEMLLYSKINIGTDKNYYEVIIDREKIGIEPIYVLLISINNTAVYRYEQIKNLFRLEEK